MLGLGTAIRQLRPRSWTSEGVVRRGSRGASPFPPYNYVLRNLSNPKTQKKTQRVQACLATPSNSAPAARRTGGFQRVVRCNPARLRCVPLRKPSRASLAGRCCFRIPTACAVTPRLELPSPGQQPPQPSRARGRPCCGSGHHSA